MKKETIKDLRRVLKAKGICALPIPKGWILVRLTEKQITSNDNYWAYGPVSNYSIECAYAVLPVEVTGRRMFGTGKGKRPYPKMSFKPTSIFKNELQALTSYMMMPERYLWR